MSARSTVHPAVDTAFKGAYRAVVALLFVTGSDPWPTSL
jgi:hypothetical protein